MSFLNQLTGGFLHTQTDTNKTLIDACDKLYKAQKEIVNTIDDLKVKMHTLDNSVDFQGSSNRVNNRAIDDLKGSVATIKTVVDMVKQIQSDMLDTQTLYIRRIDQLETDMRSVKFVMTQFIQSMEQQYPLQEEKDA